MNRIVSFAHSTRNTNPARCAKLAFIVAAAAIFASRPAETLAQAKLDVETLIGDSVADPGTKFPEVDQALTFFKNGDGIGARSLLEVAKTKSPMLPPVDVMLAKMYLITNNVPAGRAALEKAVVETAADPEPYVYLADIDLAQGGTVEAEALYDKALLLIDKMGNENQKRKRNLTIRARWGRSQVAKRRKNWPAMGSDLVALLAVDEHHAAGRYNLGEALCRVQKFPEAKQAFTAAREDDKKLPVASLAMAINYDQLGRKDDARKAYLDAMKEAPTDLLVTANYCQWLIKNAPIAEAEKALEAARKAHPDSLDLLILSGTAAAIAGKPKDAETHFISALGLAPVHGVVINHLAQLLVDQATPESSKQRALQFAVMNSRINEESVDAQVTLAWVNYKLGRVAEANAALRRALQLGSNMTPDSSYFVAVMIGNQPEQVAGAKRLLSEALTAESPGVFMRRKEAEELLKNLK